MKTPGLIVTMLLMAFAFAPAKLSAQSNQKQNYSAKLISPRLDRFSTLASKSGLNGPPRSLI